MLHTHTLVCLLVVCLNLVFVYLFSTAPQLATTFAAAAPPKLWQQLLKFKYNKWPSTYAHTLLR